MLHGFPWDGLFIREVLVYSFRKTSGLRQKFNIGRDRKQDLQQVTMDMRTACIIDGERMFNTTEWLSNIQILGLFSRLRLKQRSKIQQESNGATNADDEDDDLMEANASDRCRRRVFERGEEHGNDWDRTETSSHVWYLRCVLVGKRKCCLTSFLS